MLSVVSINNNNNDNYVKVLLVTGGGGWDSTEILPFLPDLATSWSYTASLPHNYNYIGLRGATINNKVFITGTNIDALIVNI